MFDSRNLILFFVSCVLRAPNILNSIRRKQIKLALVAPEDATPVVRRPGDVLLGESESGPPVLLRKERLPTWASSKQVSGPQDSFHSTHGEVHSTVFSEVVPNVHCRQSGIRV